MQHLRSALSVSMTRGTLSGWNLRLLLDNSLLQKNGTNAIMSGTVPFDFLHAIHLLHHPYP